MAVQRASSVGIKMAVRTGCLLAALSVCLPGVVCWGKFNIKDGLHNITMGQRKTTFPYDTLLFQSTYQVNGSWFPYPAVQSNDTCYPPKKGIHTKMFTITAFNVTDLLPKGEGGFAFITEGGVNCGKLCLHLKSERAKGYSFNVNIWGYYI